MKKTKKEVCAEQVNKVLDKNKMLIGARISFTKKLDWFGRLLVRLLNYYQPTISIDVVEK